MLRGRGISSKLNVPRLSAVELILQLKCRLKQLLIWLEENNYVNVERPWPWLFDLENMVVRHQQTNGQELLNCQICFHFQDWLECMRMMGQLL